MYVYTVSKANRIDLNIDGTAKIKNSGRRARGFIQQSFKLQIDRALILHYTDRPYYAYMRVDVHFSAQHKRLPRVHSVCGALAR